MTRRPIVGRPGASTAQRFVAVEAKLRGPVPRDDLVTRGLIVDRLMDSAHVPVVLVTGPPGFGKTVAVAQWDAVDPRPFAWVSLDRGDDDPGVFLAYIGHALHQIGIVDIRSAWRPGDDSAALQVAADRLGRLVANSRQPFVLVLDGTDAVRSRDVYEIVIRLVDDLPPGSQVVLIGRAPPPLDWARLRADDRLVEVGSGDLRLTRDEAARLIELGGASLPPDAVDALLERTEGWAAGMYLAVLGADVYDTRPDGAAVGSESVVAEYLRDEILDPLSPADQLFLRRCSILTALSAPLCDAVLETDRSAPALRRLARENTVIPHESRPGWYRIHHLFAEALQAELERREPNLVKPLHARACNWLEQHGELDDAIPHAIAAGDVDSSARLIWWRTPMSLAAGRIATVEQWLDAFTRQQVVSSAKLALSAAWCALARGNAVDHWISAAERGRYDAARQGESASVASGVALLHAMVARNGVQQMSADARLAMSLRGAHDEWTCSAELLDSVATYLAHGAAEARSRFEGVEAHAAGQGDHLARTAVLAELAMMSLAEDDWTGATRLYEQAARLLKEFHIGDVSSLALVPGIGALLAARAGRRQDAEAQLRSCVQALASIVEMPPWLAVQSRQVLARAHLLLGDAVATRTLLSETQRLLRSVPDARLLRDDADALWRQVEQVPIDLARDASSLTTAELRVLQLLPTYLSFQEIGRQLFVSRNTVKTQAIAAYRKLGVTSRAEAVERAYSMGLITR